MSDKNSCSLETIAQNLGIEDTIELLEYALPRIAQRQKKIQESLLAEDWEAASKCAHQTISSVRLYGTEELEKLLRQAKQAGEDTADADIVTLQQELLAEFDHVSQTIREWLLHKCPVYLSQKYNSL